MNCMDLFVAAVAVGFGFCVGKELFNLFLGWADGFGQNRKKLWYIFLGIFLLLVLLYLSYAFSATQLF